MKSNASFSSEEQPTLRIDVNKSATIDASKNTIDSYDNKDIDTTVNRNEPWSIMSWQDEPLNDYKVLIVDDEPDIVLLLKVIIESVGCRIITADSGKSALALIRESPPDLIISDVMMPDMDGYQLHQTLKSDPEWRLIPVIFLTARVQQQEKLQALTMGIDDYWTKPFDAAEIRVRVQSILRRLNRLKKLAEKP
jgi:CheY-like chemotaxis protein